MGQDRFFAKEWLDKRKKILARDNYTCQNCKTFNPSLGMVQYYRHDDSSLELHEYESNPGSSIYRISSNRSGITLEMDFGLNWLVLPVLQIHHRRYIENHQLWDYDDSYLVTLCKDCHTLGHENVEIPVYGTNGKLIHKKKFTPEDESREQYHDYVPWVFISMDYKTRKYELASVQPTLSIFIQSTEFEKIDKIREDSKLMCKDFFETFLPRMNNGIKYAQ